MDLPDRRRGRQNGLRINSDLGRPHTNHYLTPPPPQEHRTHLAFPQNHHATHYLTPQEPRSHLSFPQSPGHDMAHRPSRSLNELLTFLSRVGGVPRKSDDCLRAYVFLIHVSLVSKDALKELLRFVKQKLAGEESVDAWVTCLRLYCHEAETLPNEKSKTNHMEDLTATIMLALHESEMVSSIVDDEAYQEMIENPIYISHLELLDNFAEKKRIGRGKTLL